MDKNDIIALLQALSSSTVSQLAYRQGDTTLKLSKSINATVHSPPLPSSEVWQVEVPVVPQLTSSAIPQAAATPQASPDKSTDTTCVKSPLVGVCYTRASPESPDFVTLGQTVNAGDILCLIEAMKVMNEIKSPKAGKVVSLPMVSGDLVEFGQVLVEIS